MNTDDTDQEKFCQNVIRVELRLSDAGEHTANLSTAASASSLAQATTTQS